jgi:hypothetical protein
LCVFLAVFGCVFFLGGGGLGGGGGGGGGARGGGGGGGGLPSKWQAVVPQSHSFAVVVDLPGFLSNTLC